MDIYISYWAILVAAVSSFIVGALWYAPFLFGKAWQAAARLTDESMKNANMGRTFGLSFVLSLIISIGMAMFFGDEVDLQMGAMYGMMTAVFFVIPSLGVNDLFEQRPLKLWLINAGYNLVTYMVIGAILGVWP